MSSVPWRPLVLLLLVLSPTIVLAALLRAAIAVLGGYVVVRLKADVTWNFVAVGLGMVAFGLFALPALINRTGYE